MDFKIEKSEIMDMLETNNLNEERDKIRIPRKLREEKGITVNSTIAVLSEENRKMELKVLPAYREDYQKNQEVAYVTSVALKFLLAKSTEKKITYGCDPELFVVDKETKKIIDPTRFFPVKQAQVGHDGLMLEIRPDPSENIEDLSINIRDLLGKANKIIPKNLTLLSKSNHNGISAGFHVHFGLPASFLHLYHSPEKSLMMMQMLKVLDFYIGIPSMLAEGDDSVRRTAQVIDYGKPGNYRMDRRTFEYRVPGGMLLKHPILTLGLLSLSAIVMEDLIKNVGSKTNNFTRLDKVNNINQIRELYPHVLDTEEIFKAICVKETDIAMKYLGIVIEDLKAMKKYNEHKSKIENFLKFVFSKEKQNDNVEENWRNHGIGKQLEISGTQVKTATISK